MIRRMRGSLWSFLWLSLAIFLPLGGPQTTADLLIFSKGGRVQLPIRRDGSKVILDAPQGPLEFLATDFSRIVPVDEPTTVWPAKLAKAKQGTIDEQFAAAWWALENGLTPEALNLLHEIQAKSPNHQPTGGFLKRLTQVSATLNDPDLRPVLQAIGGSFRQARSDHFLLLHQGKDDEARARLDLLERVYTTYHLVFAASGIELQAPRHRLIEAVFATHDDYLSFLKRERATAFTTTQGFFQPTLNLVISYDHAELPNHRGSRSAIARRRKELEALKPTIDAMPKNARLKIEVEGEPAKTATPNVARNWLEVAKRDLARQELLLELDRRSLDFGMAAHETIHSLVANTGLAPSHDNFPVWLHEGLASQFEVIRGGRWAGVSRAHDLRLNDWRNLKPAPRIPPIVRDTGFGRGYDRDLYASAWSLVYFLRKEHARPFANYLDLLRSPAPLGEDPKQHGLDLFRKCFGEDLTDLEISWHRYLRTIKTPAEESLSTPKATRP